jgi:hypothetical protein
MLDHVAAYRLTDELIKSRTVLGLEVHGVGEVRESTVPDQRDLICVGAKAVDG